MIPRWDEYMVERDGGKSWVMVNRAPVLAVVLGLEQMKR
jgi:hypothetical protein